MTNSTKTKDFTKWFPQEVSRLIFSGLDSKTLLKATTLNSSWHAYAQVQLVQNPPLPKTDIHVGRMAAYLKSWKKTVVKHDCGKHTRYMYICPPVNEAQAVIEAVLESGILVDDLTIILDTPQQIGQLSAKWKTRMAEFFGATKELKLYLVYQHDMDLLDVIVLNSRRLTVNLVETEQSSFHASRKEAPLLEEFRIEFNNPGYTLAPSVDAFVRHYDMPNLRRFSSNVPISDKSLKHVISANLKELILNCFMTLLRKVLNMTSQCNLEILYLSTEASKHVAVNYDLEQTDMTHLSELRLLHVEDTMLSQVGVLRIARASPKLETLEVVTNPVAEFYDSRENYFLSLLTSCPNLTNLTFQVCYGFRQRSLQSLRKAIDKLGSKVKLKTLDVSGCDLLAAENSVKEFFLGFPLKLDRLTVSPDEVEKNYCSAIQRLGYVKKVTWLENDNVRMNDTIGAFEGGSFGDPIDLSQFAQMGGFPQMGGFAQGPGGFQGGGGFGFNGGFM